MRTVLLVDDEPAVVSGLSQMFVAHGWEVVTAANGTKAVALAHERFFDIVLSDVIMEGLVGTALLDAFRATRGAAQASFVLMSNMQENRVRRLIPGDYAFIAKSFTWDELMALIARECPAEAETRRNRPRLVADSRALPAR